MAKKIDGVIEAVRYKNGQISMARVYEKRGATFSDRVIVDRKILLERLQKGQQYITGSREDLLASTFTVGKSVLLVKKNDREFLATHENANNDELEGVPLF
ncbi:MAG: hypothetical protein AABZ00_12010 [Chloroflexota bacterium]|jgi:hypothetical protein